MNCPHCNGEVILVHELGPYQCIECGWYKQKGMNKAELHDDLAKLFGWPPHDDPSNICWNDGYYALSLEKKYGKSIEELKKEDANGQRTGRNDQARVRNRDGRGNQSERDSTFVDDGTGAPKFRDRVAAYAALVVTLKNFIAWADSQNPHLRESYLQDYGPKPKRPVAGDWQAIDVRHYPYPTLPTVR